MSTINPFAMPGMGTVNTSTENAFLWNNGAFVMRDSGVILSSTTDSGSSPTTTLRPGLLMGVITSTGKLTAYSSTATDGSQYVYGVLEFGVNMLDFQAGTVADMMGQVVIGGPVRASALYNLDYAARQQMANRFIFDDDVSGYPYRKGVEAKTADYTVTAADTGKIFTTAGAAGAVNFTLPTCAVGYRYLFLNEVNQNMTVTAPSGKLVAFNNATATSIAFSTASEKIGCGVEIIANADGSKYIALPILGAETATPTIA